MSRTVEGRRRRGPVALAELVGRAIAPVTARRGFATADLVAAWPEIAGPLCAGFTAPDRIAWPRRSDGGLPGAGVLFLKVDGPRAVFVQHDLPQIVERVNAFFGYRAIAQIRIVQAPVAASAPGPVAPSRPRLDPAAESALAATVAEIEDDRLRQALARLGRGVHTALRE